MTGAHDHARPAEALATLGADRAGLVAATRQRRRDGRVGRGEARERVAVENKQLGGLLRNELRARFPAEERRYPERVTRLELCRGAQLSVEARHKHPRSSL